MFSYFIPLKQKQTICAIEYFEVFNLKHILRYTVQICSRFAQMVKCLTRGGLGASACVQVFKHTALLKTNTYIQM